MRNMIVSLVMAVLIFVLIAACVGVVKEECCPIQNEPTPVKNEVGPDNQINNECDDVDGEYGGVDEYGRPRQKKNQKRFPHLFPRIRNK